MTEPYLNIGHGIIARQGRLKTSRKKTREKNVNHVVKEFVLPPACSTTMARKVQ